MSGRYSSVILLRKENKNLRQQIESMQAQLNDYKKQLTNLRFNLNSPPKKPAMIKAKSSEPINGKKIDTNNAKNMLMAKFSPRDQRSNSHSDLSEISDDKLKKYEIMVKIGVDLTNVIKQMNEDKVSSKIIDHFKTLHGMKTESAPMIDLSAPKFSKYHRMKKLHIPIKNILNKMKGDGFSQEERDAFCGKSSASNKKETDPMKIAQSLGLPSKPSIPKPVNAMKRVHWKPIDLNRVKTSIWSHINHEWFDYDPVMFELNFQTRKRKEKIQHDALQSDVMSDEKTNNLNVSDETVQFLDAKRSQMVQIGLRRFNMTNDELREMILALNEEKIEIDHLNALIDIVPTPEEQIQAEKASEYRKVQHFGIAERFFYSLYDIVELKNRLQKWRFKRLFDEKCNEIKQELDIINTAKMTILRSDKLKQIFGILLAFGNHMNVGNVKGNAYGFTLNGLSLLPQIKTTDNSMTFPMFLWAFIKNQYPNLTLILKEFESVQSASRIDTDITEKKYDSLRTNVRDLKAMLNRYKEEYFELIDLEDGFLTEMDAFTQKADEQIEQLKVQMDTLPETEKQFIEFFAYETDQSNGAPPVTLKSIFKDIVSFISMLRISKKKVNELELSNLRKEKREERKLKKRRKKRSKTQHMTRNKFAKMLNRGGKKQKKNKNRHTVRTHELYNAQKEKEKEKIANSLDVSKQRQSRNSGYWDPSTHSSFESFKKSRSKSKFKEEDKNDHLLKASVPKRSHVRIFSQDDSTLDEYADDAIFAGSPPTKPMLFESKSMLIVSSAPNSPMPMVSKPYIAQVAADNDGNVKSSQSSAPMIKISNMDDVDAENENLDMPKTPDSPSFSEESPPSFIELPDLDVLRERRNSDPCQPRLSIARREKAESGLIKPSLLLAHSTENENESGLITDENNVGILCVIEDNDKSKMSGNNQIESKSDKTLLKAKKKRVRISANDKKSKKKKKKKRKNTAPNPKLQRSKSTKDANDLTATFF